MFSKIFLSKENLLYNVNKIEEISKKKTCVMIKANAYGHGTKEVLSILNDRIDFFGVSNQSEGLYARKYTTKDVIVFGACEDYKQCIINNVSFAPQFAQTAPFLSKTANVWTLISITAKAAASALRYVLLAPSAW